MRVLVVPLAWALLSSCTKHEPPPPQQVSVPGSGTAVLAEPSPLARGADPVALGGGGAEAKSTPNKKPETGPRIYARSRFVWIREAPASNVTWIGYLWSGGSVKLKETQPRPGPGCVNWYAVEPRGFVCVDDKRATLNADDPVVKQLQEHGARLDTPWPHHYAESRDAQLYDALPSEEEQRRREWDWEAHLERVAAARQGQVDQRLNGVDLTLSSSDPFNLVGLPQTAHEQRTRLRPASTVAYSHDVLHEGRSFLLTADYLWVPKDRVAPYKKVTFHGVELGNDVKLPIAFFRGEDRTQYEMKGEAIAPTGEVFKRLSWVQLTGSEREYEGETYLEVRGGRFVRKGDAVVPVARTRTPWGATVGQPDETPSAPKGRATWIEASVWGGWLLAYEGTRPVYATMISPGRGGTPVPGKDPLETASTPVGTFKITGKFATATMVAPHEFTHSDVPWTQNFSGPHALHGAYWHDDWGNRKSAGCVNVSPIDGKWLYEFTEPRVPEGWHGLRWQPTLEPATTYIVGR